jgi:hypothetical protein
MRPQGKKGGYGTNYVEVEVEGLYVGVGPLQTSSLNPPNSNMVFSAVSRAITL